MQSNNKTQISNDPGKKQIKVTRKFEAPVEKVWEAWTNPELIDKWWAPKPWKAETKSQDFRQGGGWMYAMTGPDGTRQWCKVDYKTIVPQKSFSGYDAFCDEEGNIDSAFPRTYWEVVFEPFASGTSVHVLMTFESEEDMNKLLEMGFAEGFTSAHGNLDALLEVNDN